MDAAQPTKDEVEDTQPDDTQPDDTQPDDTQPEKPTPTQNAPELVRLICLEKVEALEAMGFSRIRAEKAVLFTQSASLETAVGWLEEHQSDEDIDEPLQIVQRGSEGADEGEAEPEKPRLSAEEAQEKARDLQRRLRDKRLEKEKEEERSREKNRMESSKQMQDTQRQLKEAEKQRALAQLVRERDQHAAEKKAQQEALKREWEARFGRPYPEDEDKSKEIESKSGKEKILHYLSKMKQLHRAADPEGFKVCLGTIRKLCENARANPTDAKFLRIRKDNAAIQSRVLRYEGAADLLKAVGFKEDEGAFEIKGPPDGFLLGLACKYIDAALHLK